MELKVTRELDHLVFSTSQLAKDINSDKLTILILRKYSDV